MIAAMSLTSLVPNVVDLSRFQFLRAFHLIILRWEELMTLIGNFIGRLPIIPELSANMMNYILFVFSVGLPASFGLWRWAKFDIAAQEALEILRNTENFGQRFRWWVKLFPLILLTAFLPFVFIGLGLGTVLFFGTLMNDLETGLERFQNNPLAVLLNLSPLALAIYMLTYVPQFGRAAFIVASFIAAFELLYLANTPFLSDWIDRRYCEISDTDNAECSSI